MRTALLIPALDEAEVIGGVVREFAPWIERIVVVDNGSRDETAARAREAGAEVVLEQRRGYGSACLAGLRYLGERGPPAVVVFGDGDGACDPSDLPALLAPIASGTVTSRRTSPSSRIRLPSTKAPIVLVSDAGSEMKIAVTPAV